MPSNRDILVVAGEAEGERKNGTSYSTGVCVNINILELVEKLILLGKGYINRVDWYPMLCMLFLVTMCLFGIKAYQEGNRGKALDTTFNGANSPKEGWLEILFSEKDGAFISYYDAPTGTWTTPQRLSGIPTSDFRPAAGTEGALTQSGISATDLPPASRESYIWSQPGVSTEDWNSAAAVPGSSKVPHCDQGQKAGDIPMIVITEEDDEAKDGKKNKKDDKDRKKDRNTAPDIFHPYLLPVVIAAYVLIQ